MNGDRAIVVVEEDHVEGEAHREGVDAGAAWDQQPGARLVAGKPGEAEQAAVEGDGYRDGAAADPAPGKRLEAIVVVVGRHE
jgi:hypothetical protein